MYYYEVKIMTDDFKEETYSGIAAAESYPAAVKKVSEWYGAEKCIYIYIEEWVDILEKSELLESLNR